MAHILFRVVISFLLLTVSLFGQDAASTALLVLEQKLDALGPALESSDALTRAAAARVALIRNVDTLLPALRTALAAEKDAAAAREQMRALVLLGTDEDVAFAASHLARFPASIDGDFAEAVGRIGAPRATSVYLKHVVGLRDAVPAIDLALWGRSSLATATASRLRGAGDERAFESLMRSAAKAKVVLDPGVLTAALASESNEIVSATVWHLIEVYAFDPAKVPESLREKATAPRESASVEEAFGRELLRRMFGAKAVERAEYLAWLRTPEARGIARASDVNRLLTNDEKTALDPTDDSNRPRPSSHPAQTVSTPEFMLPILLPDGLAEAILRKTKCSSPWVSVVKATVDRTGRVQTLDLSKVGAPAGCAKALDAMLRLSLAEPSQITSPLESSNLLVVKPRGRSVCFDEEPVTDAVAPRELMRIEGGVTTPKIVKRVEPMFPESARKEMKGGNVVIVAESVITRTGCVRDIRLLQQSPWPELNAAAVIALSGWTFEPGKLDGVPVDVIFNLSINFKTY